MHRMTSFLIKALLNVREMRVEDVYRLFFPSGDTGEAKNSNNSTQQQQQPLSACSHAHAASLAQPQYLAVKGIVRSPTRPIHTKHANKPRECVGYRVTRTDRVGHRMGLVS